MLRISISNGRFRPKPGLGGGLVSRLFRTSSAASKAAKFTPGAPTKQDRSSFASTPTARTTFDNNKSVTFKDVRQKGPSRASDTHHSASTQQRPRLLPSHSANLRPTNSSARSRKLTPSQLFMEERNNSLAFSRTLAERNARKAEREMTLLTLTAKSTKHAPSPKYTSQLPKTVPGDIGHLFGPEAIQNRDVLPGDFVEVRRQGKAIYAIYLQNFDQAEGRLQSTSVTQGDQILTHRTADVTFRIPGYLFMDKIKASIGLWDVDAHPTEAPAGAGKVAATFADESRSIMGNFYTKFDTLYDTFWHQRGIRTFTTAEAARFAFGKEDPHTAPLTLQELYATHLYLTQDTNLLKFIPSVAVRWTGEFAMRPPPEVLLTATVVDWMRKGDPRLTKFLDKVKPLVSSYRTGDKSTWKGVTFTDSDRTLIEFVRQTAFNGYSDVFSSPHLTYLPRLLRPLEAYGDIDGGTAFTFLKEIGVWPSWYNMEINRSAISLTGNLEEERAILHRISKLTPESVQQDFERDVVATSSGVSRSDGKSVVERPGINPIVLQDPTELYRRDPCDSIRHDFGHLPVFAIDDPSASELDDAFSVEAVPITTLTPTPSTWVHVHVADPTSLLPPLHQMSRLAAERVQTAYLPEGSWPMLPRSLTEDTLSLKNDGRPKKVLTFSARLSDEGSEILEYKIRPGLVKNVAALNYDDVDEFLSWDRVHGGRKEGDRVRNSMMNMPEERTQERQYYRASKGSVNVQDKELILELQGLQIIAQRHQDARLRNGAFNFSLGRPTIELTPYPLQPVAEAGWDRPVDFSQWHEPQISCRLDPGFASPSRLMVAEYMVLAGRIAAMFAQERGLPMLYRNQLPPAKKYRAQFEDQIRQKTDPKTGMMGLVDMLPLRPYIPGAEISTTPRGHWSMGVHDGYCKVTSPLRRYSDMVSHWQLKGALLSNQQSSSSVIALATAPVFSMETLVPLTGIIRDRERMLGMLEARSVKFWLFEMLRRRLESGLPNVFEGIVMNPTGDGYNVLSTLLGFQTVVKAQPHEAEGLSIGSRVSFEVNEANPQRPWVGAKHLASL